MDSQGNFNQSLTSLLAQQPKNQTLALTLQAKDRAGNEQALTYHFLNLDLQPIGDEGTWDSSLDSEYNNMSPTAPSNGGSSGSSGTGSGYLYLGLNGQWGTYGSGGSGGTGWSPVPMNGGDPATGYSLPPNLPETLPYLQALEVILKVATALISPQPETVAKKAMLHKVRDLLVHEVGLYARDYGVYSGDNYTHVGLTQAMGGVFNDIFVAAYGTDGSISKTEAVNQGIALAKALLADNRSVRLQTFQAQVLATTLGSVDPAQHTPELRQTALALADSYSRFRPGTDSYQGMATNFNSSYLDALWQLQQPFALGQQPTYWNSNQTWDATTVDVAAWHLQSGLNWKQTANHAGLTEVNALKALRMVNTMLGALSQISPLWQGQGSGVQDGIFLRQALGLAMALAKLPTTPSTDGDSGNWVNAILQGDAQTAATGLAQLFAGMETADPLRLRQQLNFVETLLNVAAAVDDPALDQVVLQSAFLSQYLNLGGAYAALNPNVDGTLGFFLDTAWQERSQDFNFDNWNPNGSSITLNASNELEKFLTTIKLELVNFASFQPLLSFLTRVAWSFKVDQFNIDKLTSHEITSVFSMSYDYYKTIQAGLEVESNEGIFESIYQISSRPLLQPVAQLIASSMLNQTTLAVLSEQFSSQDSQTLASSNKPSDEVLDKILERYWKLVANAYQLGFREGGDNLAKFLRGDDSPKYVDYSWLHKFNSVRFATAQVKSALSQMVQRRAYQEIQVAGLVGSGSEEHSVKFESDSSYNSKQVLQNDLLYPELLFASGAAAVHGNIDKIRISRYSKDTAFGKSNKVTVSANAEYYWYDDYNWNPGGYFPIPGLGNFYDDEANLLVKYRGAKPYALYSGWDQEIQVVYSQMPRLKPLALVVSQPGVVLRYDRYIFGKHTPWIQEDIDQARVINQY